MGSTIPTFSPPANLQELSTENQSVWSKDYISTWMNQEIAGQESGRSPLSQFFNGTITAYNVTQQASRVTWIGFPNRVSSSQILKSKYSSLISCRSALHFPGAMRSDGRLRTRVVPFKTNTWNGRPTATTIATS